MRCTACDVMIHGAPLTLKLEDGTRVENTLCNFCNYVGENPDYVDYIQEDNFIESYLQGKR